MNALGDMPPTHTAMARMQAVVSFVAITAAILFVAPIVGAQDGSTDGTTDGTAISPDTSGEPEGSPETLGTTTGDGEGEDEDDVARAEDEREEAEDRADEAAAAEGTPDGEGSAEELGTPAGDAEGEDEDDTARTEAEAEAAQAATEPLAWRNSFFSWTQGLTFNTIYPNGQQTYDPYYYWSFSLLPRWYIEPTLFLIASLGVSYELTDSNSDTYNHELALSDALVELRYTAAVDRFVFIPAVRLTFPTSKASQAAQRYFNTGIGLTSVLQIPEFLSSNIALGLSYRRWWAGSNVSVTGPYPGTPARPTRFNTSGAFDGASGDIGAPSVDSMGGAANASDRILVSLTFNVTPVSGFTLTLQGLMVFDHLYDNSAAYLDCATIVTQPCNAQPWEVPGDANAPRWRAFTYFTLAAAYDVQPWLNLQLGVANAGVLAPLLNDDGSVRSPFNPDTQIYLSATVTLDGLYETITAGGEEDGLTPEERQRRRQGLASLGVDLDALDAATGASDGNDDESADEAGDEDGGATSSRGLVAF